MSSFDTSWTDSIAFLKSSFHTNNVKKWLLNQLHETTNGSKGGLYLRDRNNG